MNDVAEILRDRYKEIVDAHSKLVGQRPSIRGPSLLLYKTMRFCAMRNRVLGDGETAANADIAARQMYDIVRAISNTDPAKLVRLASAMCNGDPLIEELRVGVNAKSMRLLAACVAKEIRATDAVSCTAWEVARSMWHSILKMVIVIEHSINRYRTERQARIGKLEGLLSLVKQRHETLAATFSSYPVHQVLSLQAGVITQPDPYDNVSELRFNGVVTPEMLDGVFGDTSDMMGLCDTELLTARMELPNDPVNDYFDAACMGSLQETFFQLHSHERNGRRAGVFVSLLDGGEKTTLERCIEINDFEMYMSLLDQGCKLRLMTLFMAAQSRNILFILYAIACKANIDTQFRTGQTSLHVAIKRDNYDVAAALVAAGASTSILDSQGKSPCALMLEAADPRWYMLYVSTAQAS